MKHINYIYIYIFKLKIGEQATEILQKIKNKIQFSLKPETFAKMKWKMKDRVRKESSKFGEQVQQKRCLMNRNIIPTIII
jgi:hypothetical protein